MTAKSKARKAPAPKVATSPSGTAAEATACFMEICKGRDRSEIERIEAFLEVAFPRQRKAEEMERDTAALHETEEAQERLTDVRLADEIDTIKRRSFGLEMAVEGANVVTGGDLGGVIQLASDLANGMARLAAAFAAERQLRRAEERQ